MSEPTLPCIQTSLRCLPRLHSKDPPSDRCAARNGFRPADKAYAQANSAAEAGAAGIGDDSLVLRCGICQAASSGSGRVGRRCNGTGPSRLVRWASVALPWILRFRADRRQGARC